MLWRYGVINSLVFHNIPKTDANRVILDHELSLWSLWNSLYKTETPQYQTHVQECFETYTIM